MVFQDSHHCTTATPKTGNKLAVTLALVLLAPVTYSASTGRTAEGFSYDLAGRIRSESVDQAGNNGSALTAKLRTTGHYLNNNFKYTVEVDYVENWHTSQHSDGVTITAEPVIADPRGFDLNRLQVQYQANNIKATLGRQKIEFDDQRFIGDLGFRQNEQTFDALRLSHKTLGGVKTDYIYIARVNRLFGRQADSSLSRTDIRFNNLNGRRLSGQLGQHDVDGHWLNVSGQVHDYVELGASFHSIHNSDHAPFSNRTFTLTADVDYKPGKTKWESSLIYARQKKQETANKDWLSFYRIELSASQGPYKLSYRQESFGSQRGQAFVTPLATLHKFQGWADRFLNIPNDGLEDRSLLARWKRSPYTIDARYHWFQSDANQRDFGEEFNLDLIYTPSRDHEVKIRFADFKADNGASNQIDVRKLLLMYSYKL